MSEFPQGFIWGAANAAYQVEGAAARRRSRSPSIWDTFSHQPGKVFRGDTGDIACDQYHRLDSDLDLMSDDGAAALPFLGFAWSRIMPEGTGAINDKGLDYYERMVDGLHCARHHADADALSLGPPANPAGHGRLGNRDVVRHFADYVSVVNKSDSAIASPIGARSTNPGARPFSAIATASSRLVSGTKR